MSYCLSQIVATLLILMYLFTDLQRRSQQKGVLVVEFGLTLLVIVDLTLAVLLNGAKESIKNKWFLADLIVVGVLLAIGLLIITNSKPWSSLRVHSEEEADALIVMLRVVVQAVRVGLYFGKYCTGRQRALASEEISIECSSKDVEINTSTDYEPHDKQEQSQIPDVLV